MRSTYIVTGTLDDASTIKLDEALPSSVSRVRVIIEPIDHKPKKSITQIIDEIREQQASRSFKPPTAENVNAHIRSERDSWEDLG